MPCQSLKRLVLVLFCCMISPERRGASLNGGFIAAGGAKLCIVGWLVLCVCVPGMVLGAPEHACALTGGRGARFTQRCSCGVSRHRGSWWLHPKDFLSHDHRGAMYRIYRLAQCEVIGLLQRLALGLLGPARRRSGAGCREGCNGSHRRHIQEGREGDERRAGAGVRQGIL